MVCMPFNEIVVMTEKERFITLVHSKGHCWLPDCMGKSRPVRTKALYPIFADRRTRTGSVLKQIAGEGLT